jgi:N-acetylneuraminic acid mutarotase
MNTKHNFGFTMLPLMNNRMNHLFVLKQFIARGLLTSVSGVLFVFSGFMFSCSNNPSETTSTLGNWSKTTPFKGRPRSGAVVFTIGSTAFIGLGYDGDQYITDFYAYDLRAGFWATKKSFPGTARERAVAFSANGKGYVGLGYNREQNKEELGDLWQYDPAADTWTRVADFGGTARYNAVGFAIGGKAYVGTGYDGDTYNSDFWEYDVANNSWREIQSYPGEKIEGGLSFVIGENGYVCTGRNNGLHNTDFWEFSPSEVTWTKRTPSTDASDYAAFKLAVSRHDAVAFTAGGFGYIIGGISSTGATDKTVYQFDPSTYTWESRTSFEGAARSLAVAFALEERLFLGTGQNGTSRFDDIWEFKPTQAYDENN